MRHSFYSHRKIITTLLDLLFCDLPRRLFNLHSGVSSSEHLKSANGNTVYVTTFPHLFLAFVSWRCSICVNDGGRGDSVLFPGEYDLSVHTKIVTATQEDSENQNRTMESLIKISGTDDDSHHSEPECCRYSQLLPLRRHSSSVCQ